MRQTIGGSWLIGLMVLFIFLFAGYIILTIDYNKSIRVKNEAIAIVEKYEGLNEQSIRLLNNYLMGAGYMTTGKCGQQDGLYGALSLEDSELEETEENQRYYYCVKKYKGANTSYYYQLSLFYRFNLPVLGDTSRFTIKGSTANFQPKDETKYAKTIDGSTGGVQEGNGGNNQEVLYTVRFNVNGGTTSIPNQRVVSGYRATRPSNPVRNGYTFNGWKLGGATYDFSNPVTGNITLVADWIASGNAYEPQTCEIGFLAYEGSKKYYRIEDEYGNEVTSVSAGRKYTIIFQTYLNGPLSKDSDRITQQDLNAGYGCRVAQIGVTSNDNIIRDVNTGIYNVSSDIDKNNEYKFKEYDKSNVIEAFANIQIPSNYSGRTLKFTGIIQGISSPIYESFEIKVN